MSILEDSSLSVEMPAISAHGTDPQANATHHRGTAALEGITLTRRCVTRTFQDIIKPAIKTFLETCDTHPRIAAVVATPALLGFLLILAFFTISTFVLVVWTVFTVTTGIIFVIAAGILSLFFKLLVVVLVSLPLTAIAAGLLVGANTVSQSIISRMPQKSVGPTVTQTFKETDWKSVVEHLINCGKNLGSGSATALEILMVALHKLRVIFISVIEDLHDTENLRHNDPLAPKDSSAAETSGERTQANLDSVLAQSAPEHSEQREFQSTGSSEGLKRRAPLSTSNEDQ